MKKLSIFLLLAFTILAIHSCKTEDDVVFVVQETEGVVFTNTVLPKYILTEATATNIGERFTWESSDFGEPTNVSYDFEWSTTADFSTFETEGSTTASEYALTIGDMLSYAIAIELDNDPQTDNPNTGAVYVRVRAYVGAGGMENYSEVQVLNLEWAESTGDEEPMLPLIAVPGNHQGWDPPTAPHMAASATGETNYEGFVWLDGEYKFLAPDADGNFNWGNIDWGDDGTFTGVLVETDEVNCISDAGYYLMNANTTALTYSATLTNWGVIGNATPTGWDSDTDMIYDQATGLWTLTLELTEQVPTDNGLKFRANDAWDLNLGDTGADGTLEFGGDNIGVPASGTYLITLDLSNPRNYTYSLELL